MDKKPYETPKVEDLGSVTELTEQGIDKCSGSGDSHTLASLEPNYTPAGQCPPDF